MESSHAGRVLVRVNLLGTAVFALTATYAAVVFDTVAMWTGSITALTLFAIGVAAFLWSFWNAVQRSRSEELAVTQLYLLLGDGIPARVRRTMNLALVAQFAIATATALARPNGPDGNPGSSLAVGFLVPMFGFGLNGLWAAYHGTFGPRADRRVRARDDDHRDRRGDRSVGGSAVTDSDGSIGQNADHG